MADSANTIKKPATGCGCDLEAFQRERANAWRAYLRADRAWERAGDRWIASIGRFNRAKQALDAHQAHVDAGNEA